MAREHVSHGDIAQFAQDRVNLPKDSADDYRAQVRRLRDKLENYLDEHPDFTLKRMQLSGSLAKGTALRSLNDIDVACYVAGADVPNKVSELLEYLAERLRKAFPNFTPDQVEPQTYSVSVGWTPDVSLPTGHFRPTKAVTRKQPLFRSQRPHSCSISSPDCRKRLPSR